MVDVKISSFPTDSSPLTGAELVTGLVSGVNTNMTTLAIAALAATADGYTTVGTGAQYDYPTINAAVTAGHQQLYVLTDITETVSTTFTSDFTLWIKESVTISFNDAGIIGAAGQALVNIFCIGSCTFNWTFTSTNILFDFTAIAASAPANFIGQFLWSNNSGSGISSKPIATLSGSDYLVNLGPSIYVMNDSITSYFDFGAANVDVMILVSGAGPVDTYGLNISDYGSVKSLIIGGDLTSGSTIATVSNTTINNFLSLSTVANPTLKITDSVAQNGASLNAQTKILMNNSSAGTQCILNNFRNINLQLNGTNANVLSCGMASFNIDTATGGRQNFLSCVFSSPITVNNITNQMDFASCQFVQGATITSANRMSMSSCTAGDVTSPGSSYTIALGAGTDACYINNCFVDVDLTDAGTANSYSYKVF
jgi:hypothetical protein